MEFSEALQRATSRAGPHGSELADGRQSVAYGELRAHLDGIRSFLRDLGVSPDHGVVVETPNCVEGALTILAQFLAGTDFLLAPRRKPGQLRADAPAFCRWEAVVDPDERTDPRAPETFLRVSELTGPGRTGRSDDEHGPPRMYARTSGTTLDPKIVVHEHERILSNTDNAARRLGLRASDRIALPAPIVHLYGFGAGFLPGFLAGASLDFQDGANLLRFLEREESFGPDVSFLTPTFLDGLLRGRRADRPYRLTVSAGARLPEEVLRAWEPRFGPLVNLYGSTELGVVATTVPSLPDDLRAASVGTPLPGVLARLGETEGASVEDGIGELLVRHEFGFVRYVDARGTDVSGEKLEGGWFRTGDLARIHETGAVIVLGRCDDGVNRNGFLVLLTDVEAALVRLEEVVQAAVVLGDETRIGRELIAHCVVEPGRSVRGADVRARCAELLPAYAVPDRVVVRDSLPHLPSGKVDRRAVAEWER